MPEPTPEQWLELHAAFREYCEAAPWECMDDGDLVAVIHPSEGYKGYCVVMGAGGIEYGLAVYRGDEGLASYLSLVMGLVDDESPEVLDTMNSLVAMLADREQLSQPDRDVIRSLSLRYRGRGRWPFFRSNLPGYAPWRLGDEEAAFLALALRNVIEVAAQFQGGMIKLFSPEGVQLFVTRFLEDGAWQQGWEPLEAPAPPSQDFPEYHDAERLHQLSASKKLSSNVWEFDIFYLYVPEHLEKGDRPYLPVTAIIADRDSPLCWSKMHDGPNPSASERQDLLVALFETCPFLPGEIVVDTPLTAALVESVAKLLGIELSVGDIPEADEVRAMLNQM